MNAKQRIDDGWAMELLGANNLKKGADVTAVNIRCKRSSWTKRRRCKNHAFKEKERGCTIRLFGMNSLKEGAV
jgi:hypothetical protein